MMIRKTLTILSLIGLLLSVGLWATSYHGETHKKLSKTEGMDHFAVHGTLWLIMWTGGDRSGTDNAFGYGTRRHAYIPWFESQTVGRMQSSFLILPLYLPVFIFAILPLLAVRLIHRRRKRMKLGLCLNCGYDLRGSKDRCSECGSPFENRRSDNNCRYGA